MIKKVSFEVQTNVIYEKVHLLVISKYEKQDFAQSITQQITITHKSDIEKHTKVYSIRRQLTDNGIKHVENQNYIFPGYNISFFASFCVRLRQKNPFKMQNNKTCLTKYIS